MTVDEQELTLAHKWHWNKTVHQFHGSEIIKSHCSIMSGSSKLLHSRMYRESERATLVIVELTQFLAITDLVDTDGLGWSTADNKPGTVAAEGKRSNYAWLFLERPDEVKVLITGNSRFRAIDLVEPGNAIIATAGDLLFPGVLGQAAKGIE